MKSQLATSSKFFQRQDLVAALLEKEDRTVAKPSANFANVLLHHHKLSVNGTKVPLSKVTLESHIFGTGDLQSRPELVSASTLERLGGTCCQLL